MNTRLASLLLMIAVCSGCHASRLVQEPISASSAVGAQDGRTERIGQVVRETMRKEKVPGISVAVIDHGRLVWAQGFGWRDVEKRLPVDTDTQFQAGSISKPV
jgi:CubicO group peptidase (beta-lactamase class C family)